MTKVQLNTSWPPAVAAGLTENHYGVPFTAVPTKDKDAKGNVIHVLQADLPDDEAKLMADAGRVAVISVTAPAETKTAETKAPAAPPAPAAPAAPAPAAK